MNTITHYEVYQAGSGQWSMVARYARSEREIAMAEARRLEDDSKVAAAVIEENEDLGDGQFEICLIHRSVTATNAIRAPASGSDLGTRFFMIALNAVTIGAIALIIAALALSRASFNPSWFNVALLAAFAGATLLSGLLLFRVYIPVGVILWRAKDPESRRRTAHTLTHGQVVASTAEAQALETEETASAPAPEAPVAAETDASPDSFQTTAGEPPPGEAEMPPPEAMSPPLAEPPPAEDAESVASVLGQSARAALIDTLKPALLRFTDDCLTLLTSGRPNPTPMDRLGFHLYLLGAATAVVERNSLDPHTARTLTQSMLDHARMNAQEIDAFFAEVDGAADRPRYRRMIEDGTIAMNTALGDAQPSALPTILELLSRWSDTGQRPSDTQQVTFLLTDMVGSTAMTSEIGNAGAQRVVRAHNAIVRAAAKAFRGREVKHTGDGMLLIFPDAGAGARAAMDIQQEAITYANDNPTAPLSLRVSLHTGEAVFEDGEYYGTAIAIVNGLGPQVVTGEICCSITVRQKLPTNILVEDLGLRTVKGATGPMQIFKILWEPKRVTKKAPLEYRHIGGTGPAPTGPESQ